MPDIARHPLPRYTMTTEPQENIATPTKGIPEASRGGFPLTIAVLAALSIIAIWYYAINRHLHTQATKREDVAARFADDFSAFYDNLNSAVDVFVASAPPGLLAASENSPAEPEESGLASSLKLISILSKAELVFIADTGGHALVTSATGDPAHPEDLLRILRIGDPGTMRAGVESVTDPHTTQRYLVITPRSLPTRGDEPAKWLSMVFKVEDVLDRIGEIGNRVNLIDRRGQVLFASMNLPGTALFKDRMTAGIWRDAPRDGAKPVVQYDSRLEFGYALLPGDNIAVIAAIPGGIDEYLLLGALLTVLVMGTIPFMLRIHASRERARQEEQRLRYYVAEIEKAKKDAERANLSKNEFLANISHEIRTLMNGVTGMLDLLSRTRMSEKQREYCDIIKASTNSLLGIINDILDFSKIEAGKMGIEEAPFDLQATAIDCLRLLSSRAEERGNDLVFDYQAGLPSHVIGDMIRLRQLITNLVSNAIKFTKDGTIVVTIEGAPAGNDRILYTIRVTDTGVGIEPEMQSRIFEKFEQADSSIARQYGGSGLGLAICKRLTTLMGGEITCSSLVGIGSTFTITLPLLRGIRDSARMREAVPADWAGHRAVVYEPNAQLRDVIRRLLESFGFTCKTTANAGEIAALMKQAIVSDVPPLLVIANGNGERIIQLARDLNEDLGMGKIVAIVTSYPAAAEELPRPEPGVTYDILLNKPLWRTQLHQAIDQAYRIHSATHFTPNAAAPAGGKIARAGTDIGILLAEDNLVNQKVALGILKKYGYDVDIANNGLEVLQRIREKRYDVILMDCQMPEMDGFEATRHVRELETANGKGHRHAIIALTADVQARDRENCLSAGMDAHVAKPINPEELVRAIQSRVVGRKGTQH